MTLGPSGTLTHAPSTSDALKTIEIRRRFMMGATGSTAGGLRRHALPAPGAFLHVRIVGLGFRAVVPVRGLRWRGVRATLLNVGRRCDRHRHHGRVVVVRRVVPW